MDLKISSQSCESGLSLSFLTRDCNQQTPLGLAIRNNDINAVKSYLLEGAASSVFIEGYMTKSLVCTLPQTAQVKLL